MNPEKAHAQFNFLLKLAEEILATPGNYLVAGGNGSGKSLLWRMVRSKSPLKCRHFSDRLLHESAKSGPFAAWDNESASSVNILKFLRGVTGICPSLKTENYSTTPMAKAILVLDEPEKGMSEESQLLLVDYIQEIVAVNDFPWVIVVTHSRLLVSGLKDSFRWINTDGKFKSANDWLARPLRPTNFDVLSATDLHLWREGNTRISHVRNH